MLVKQDELDLTDSSVFLLLLHRIVAARLNGSLDFFTVEINKPLCLLQYRGEAPQHDSGVFFPV